MVQQNFLALAKQGNAAAIASLINRQLQSKNITAKVTLKNTCLQVLLESSEIPNQQALVAFIHKGIKGLGSPAIEKVKVYAIQTGEEFPAWGQEFEVSNQLSSVSKAEKFVSSDREAEETQDSLKESAKQGNIDAITKLFNTALQHKNIIVKANLKENCLQVILESNPCPEQSSVTVIRREVTLLKLEFIKTIKVFAKQTGQDFPDWTQEIDLSSSSNSKISTPKSVSSSQTLNISINGTTVSLDNIENVLGKTLGILGAIILFIGVFTPIVSVPIAGSFNYFYNGKGDGVILIGIAIISLIIALKEKFKLLWWTGIASLGVLLLGLINFQMRISQLKSQMEDELAGNMFKGIADVAAQSIQLQWGWVILIIGTGLILAAAAIPERENLTHVTYKKYFLDLFSLKESRKSYIFLALILVGIIVPKLFIEAKNQMVYNSQLEKAKQSEAKTYIGSINRAQQFYFLESNKFSSNLEELQIGIRSETSNYKYEVVNSYTTQTLATATAKEDRLKSYTGTVFIIKDSDGNDTTLAGVCESNTSTKTPPASPQIVGNEIQCSSDSIKL
ncbi:type IV pilin-like G/H family protein [Nostoc sp. UIC 10890]